MFQKRKQRLLALSRRADARQLALLRVCITTRGARHCMRALQADALAPSSSCQPAQRRTQLQRTTADSCEHIWCGSGYCAHARAGCLPDPAAEVRKALAGTANTVLERSQPCDRKAQATRPSSCNEAAKWLLRERTGGAWAIEGRLASLCSKHSPGRGYHSA